MYGYLSAFGEQQIPQREIILLWFYNTIFALDILRNFLTEFQLEGQHINCRDLKTIAVNYMKKEFRSDFAIWLPLWELGLKNIGRDAKLFNVVKCLRLIKAWRIFDEKVLTNRI